MGLLISVKSGLSKVQTAAAKVISTGGNVVTAGIEKVTGQSYGRTTPQQVLASPVGKVITAGIVATGTAAAVVAAAPAVISKAPAVVKSVASTTKSVATAHPIATGVAAVVVAPAVATSSTLRSGITQAAKELPTFGTGLGGAIDKPSELGAFLKEHPITSAAAGVLAAYGIGKAAAPVVGAIIQKESLEEQTEAITEAITQTPTMGLTPSQLPAEKTLATDTSPAQTTPTQTIGAKRKKYKKKTSLQAQGQRISQRVNVIVSQNQRHSQIKRYLNRELLVS